MKMFGKKKTIDRLIAMIDFIGKSIPKTIKESKEPEPQPKSSPLLQLICKAQTLDELKEIQTKYRDSIGIVHGLAIICQEFDIKLKDLQERVSVLESTKEVSKGDTKTD